MGLLLQAIVACWRGLNAIKPRLPRRVAEALRRGIPGGLIARRIAIPEPTILARAELAQGVSHLLVAGDVLGRGCWEDRQVAVCGAVLETAATGDDPRYCPACVRAVVRWRAR